MTVAELIVRLQCLPQSAPVVVNYERNELANSKDAVGVVAEIVY